METVQLEWLNQNSLRAYPIREDCSRIPCDKNGNPTSKDLALPNFIITDFVMVVDSTLIDNDVYVNRVSYAGGYLNISIAADSATIATIAVDLSEHQSNQIYRFLCTGAYEASSGAITIGNLDRLADILPEGQYFYTAAQASFEATCIRPSINTVTGISVYDATTGYKTLPLHGDVKFIAGSNIEFSYDGPENTITINAADGKGYTENCDCKDYSTRVERINGIAAEDVWLRGTDCLRITESGNVITLSDTCAKPCCGCAELAFINDKISEIQTAIGRLSSYADSLTAATTAFNSMKALYSAIR